MKRQNFNPKSQKAGVSCRPLAYDETAARERLKETRRRVQDELASVRGKYPHADEYDLLERLKESNANPLTIAVQKKRIEHLEQGRPVGEIKPKRPCSTQRCPPARVVEFQELPPEEYCRPFQRQKQPVPQGYWEEASAAERMQQTRETVAREMREVRTAYPQASEGELLRRLVERGAHPQTISLQQQRVKGLTGKSTGTSAVADGTNSVFLQDISRQPPQPLPPTPRRRPARNRPRKIIFEDEMQDEKAETRYAWLPQEKPVPPTYPPSELRGREVPIRPCLRLRQRPVRYETVPEEPDWYEAHRARLAAVRARLPGMPTIASKESSKDQVSCRPCADKRYPMTKTEDIYSICPPIEESEAEPPALAFAPESAAEWSGEEAEDWMSEGSHKTEADLVIQRVQEEARQAKLRLDQLRQKQEEQRVRRQKSRADRTPAEGPCETSTFMDESFTNPVADSTHYDTEALMDTILDTSRQTNASRNVIGTPCPRKSPYPEAKPCSQNKDHTQRVAPYLQESPSYHKTLSSKLSRSPNQRLIPEDKPCSREGSFGEDTRPDLPRPFQESSPQEMFCNQKSSPPEAPYSQKLHYSHELTSPPSPHSQELSFGPPYPPEESFPRPQQVLYSDDSPYSQKLSYTEHSHSHHFPASPYSHQSSCPAKSENPRASPSAFKSPYPQESSPRQKYALSEELSYRGKLSCPQIDSPYMQSSPYIQRQPYSEESPLRQEISSPKGSTYFQESPKSQCSRKLRDSPYTRTTEFLDKSFRQEQFPSPQKSPCSQKSSDITQETSFSLNRSYPQESPCSQDSPLLDESTRFHQQSCPPESPTESGASKSPCRLAEGRTLDKSLHRDPDQAPRTIEEGGMESSRYGTMDETNCLMGPSELHAIDKSPCEIKSMVEDETREIRIMHEVLSQLKQPASQIQFKDMSTVVPHVFTDEVETTPEVAAAILHSDEKGLSLQATPAKVFSMLFQGETSDRTVMRVSAPSVHTKARVLVPTGSERVEASLLAYAGDYETLPEEDADMPDLNRDAENQGTVRDILGYSISSIGKDSVNSVVSNNDRFKIDLQLEIPKQNDLIQIRGSQPPAWFPGYYVMMGNDTTINVIDKPWSVLERAWQQVVPQKIVSETGKVIVGS